MTVHETTTRGVPTAPASLRVVPVRHWGQWVSTAMILLLVALLATSLATNPNFEWDEVFGYFLDGRVLRGLGTTLWLTVVAMAVGIVIGVIMAVGRQARNPVVSAAASAYVWFFRGTPLLVQLIFWFNLAALYPTLGVGIPFFDPLFEADTNEVITPIFAAILGLGLNEGAYMSEIVRAGLLSVDPGQKDAAEALGMRRSLIFRRIALPQAMRVIIPPTGNATIAMLKTTSLVSVISIGDLLYAVQIIYSRNFEVIPLLITISLWYLLVTTILSIGQHFLERRFNRGDRRNDQTYLGAWIAGLIPRRSQPEPAPVTGAITTEGEHR